MVLGLVAFGAGLIVLRSFGPGYRVGRLLAATRAVTIERAEAYAAAGTPRYVRVDGRVDSPDDFPDEHERPLVYRRRRLETARDRGWTIVDEEVQAVPFELRQGLGAVAVDVAQLGVEALTLVVLPGESRGTAADVPDRVPPGIPPSTPVRYRIEQVSAVEHASVLGVPELRPNGSVVLTAGLGRPLILSTLEPTEAMQMLAGGRRARPLIAMVLLAAGIGLVVVGLVWAVAVQVAGSVVPPVVLAASPDATAPAGGDTRTSGEGPGLVGAPLAAIALVGLIAATSAIVTYAYVRMTAGRSSPPPDAR